jgi:predicted enzyme related to lactoylglutathione lyase
MHHKINYIEIPVKDIIETKSFFTKVFSWSFIDYGEEYCSISNSGIDAGFYKADLTMSQNKGSALVVLYSNDLEDTQAKIQQNGGEITKAIFSFPGGRRFHFTDLNNNEYAVWSK